MQRKLHRVCPPRTKGKGLEEFARENECSCICIGVWVFFLKFRKRNYEKSVDFGQSKAEKRREGGLARPVPTTGEGEEEKMNEKLILWIWEIHDIDSVVAHGMGMRPTFSHLVGEIPCLFVCRAKEKSAFQPFFLFFQATFQIWRRWELRSRLHQVRSSRLFILFLYFTFSPSSITNSPMGGIG